MNNRIKLLRKSLNLTQQEFGERIGIKRNSVALIENGRNTSGQTIFAICREFNVNEKWLRTGEGEMFNPAPINELEALAKKYNLSSSAYVLIERFLNLKKEQQDVIIDFIKEAAAGFAKIESQKKMNPAANIDIDTEVELYRQALETQKKVADGLSVLNGENGAKIG